MTRLIILLLVSSLTSAADKQKPAHQSVIKDPEIKFVDPGDLVNDNAEGDKTPVVRVGKSDPLNLNPKKVDVGGKGIDVPPTPVTSQEFKFGVSAGGKDGLMQTNVDNGTNVVSQLTLPNGNPKNNPQKADGSPLLKSDLANLATGAVPSILLNDGTELGKPSKQQPG